MITTFVLSYAVAILTAPFTLFSGLPTLNLNSLASTITGSSAWPALGWINNYFPVAEAVALITALLAIFGIMYLVKAAIWIWNTIKP